MFASFQGRERERNRPCIEVGSSYGSELVCQVTAHSCWLISLRPATKGSHFHTCLPACTEHFSPYVLQNSRHSTKCSHRTLNQVRKCKQRQKLGYSGFVTNGLVLSHPFVLQSSRCTKIKRVNKCVHSELRHTQHN